MRYVIEIETTKELNHLSELIDFVQWFLRNIAKMKNSIKSIDVRRCDEDVRA